MELKFRRKKEAKRVVHFPGRDSLLRTLGSGSYESLALGGPKSAVRGKAFPIKATACPCISHGRWSLALPTLTPDHSFYQDKDKPKGTCRSLRALSLIEHFPVTNDPRRRPQPTKTCPRGAGGGDRSPRRSQEGVILLALVLRRSRGSAELVQSRWLLARPPRRQGWGRWWWR